MAHTKPDPSHRIRATYSNHIHSAGGIFTPTSREKLIHLVEKPKSGARENEFWYDIRIQVRNAITDLAMICDVAGDAQLKQMFEPLTTEDFQDASGYLPPKRADLNAFLQKLLNSQGTLKIDKDEYWRYSLAVQIAKTGMEYFNQKRGFDSQFVQDALSRAKEAMNIPHEMLRD